jgi:phenylacetate-CoA ligase
MGFYSTTRSVRWWLKGYPWDKYARLLEESERWSREEMQAYRDDKLRRLISHCYQNVEYYKDVMDREKLKPDDIRSAADLVKLPLLTKDKIRTCRDGLIASNVKQMSIYWAKTGGTTGEPMRICRNGDGSAWADMCYERGLRWGGLGLDTPRIKLSGGSLGIDKNSLMERVGARIRGDLFLPAFELRADTAPTFFSEIRRSKCRFLIGYASAIYRLARLAEEMDQTLQFDAVFPTAELLLPEWEETIRRVFTRHVLPYYGSGEVGSLGYSRPDCGGYFIPEEHVVIEVLQKDGSMQLSGDGAFAITDLDNYAMPIIRYVNGDAGKVSDSSDSSLPFSRIERLDGRYNSFLLTDSGDLISGVIGTHIFRHVPSVRTYRIIQETPLDVTINIVPEDSYGTKDESLILDLFAKHLGRRTKIVIQRVPHIETPPSGKSVFVINRCLSQPIQP